MTRHHEALMALARLGFHDSEAKQLWRASVTLHTWAEHECNGAIQRDEATNKPYWHSTYDGKRLGRTSDREAGALKRAQRIAAARGFNVYHQGDPRGCSLYLYRQSDLDSFAEQVGEKSVSIDSCYNSVGVAV